MFRIEFFVEDKKVPQVLRDLASIKALDVSAVPVFGAAAQSNGKLKATATNGLSPLAVAVLGYAKKHKLAEMLPDDVRNACKTAGFSRSSAGHVIGILIKAGKIQRHGSAANTRYEMLQ